MKLLLTIYIVFCYYEYVTIKGHHMNKATNTLNIFISSIPLIIGIFVASLAVGQYTTASGDLQGAEVAHVQQLCDDARIYGTVSMQACGDAQDSINTEYICEDNNNKLTNVCWVETK
jgi:hypothetical protein